MAGAKRRVVYPPVRSVSAHGFELAAEIRRRRPEIPILMTSAFRDIFARRLREFPHYSKAIHADRMATAFLQARTAFETS